MFWIATRSSAGEGLITRSNNLHSISTKFGTILIDLHAEHTDKTVFWPELDSLSSPSKVTASSQSRDCG